ncbi:MAG: JAB domain-containing protein [Bdellovibrio sp.]|nr:JAB domain-containing protein [Bdellovibrio sp.]
MSQIHNSRFAFDLLKTKFNPDAEEFWLLTLNSSLTLTGTLLIAKGTLNYCSVHPRDLFRECLRANAFAFIMAHNHPSLDVQPSDEDIKLTNRFLKIAKLLEIPMLDHLVFTDTAYYSFKENNLLSRK